MAESLTYSVEEAASVLGVSRGTVYNAIKSGQLASFTVGARRLIARDEVERLTEPKPIVPA